MFKLYKRDDTGRIIAYHEAWAEPDRRRIVEHWGMVGERGDTATHRIKLLHSLERQFDGLLDPARALGFGEITESDYATLIVEYPYGECWQRDDSEKIRAAEDALTEILGWTGLGHCIGETLGDTHLQLTCRVISFDLASEQITAQLAETEFADYSRISEE